MRGWGPERPAYLWLLLATLVLNVFSGIGSDALGLPISPDRLTLAAALGLLALDPWAWRRVRWHLRPVHVAMVALVVLAAWSAFVNDTLLTGYGLFALADRLLVPFVLFAVAPVVFCTPERRDLLLKALTVLGLYLAITAVLERVAPSLVYPRYIVDPSLGIQAGRSRGPFVASEAMGLVLVQCAFAAAFLSSRSRRAWRRIALLTTALCAVGVLLTLTRSVWLGALIGVVVACAQQRELRRLLPVMLAGGAVVVVALLAAVPSLQAAVNERATTTRSLDDRRNVNEAALRLIEREPLTGVGWVGFIDASDEYVRQADDYPVTNVRIEVHNVPLARAAELGIPGALLWALCVVLGPLRAVLRRVPRSAPVDLVGWRLVLTGGAATWGVALLLSPVPYPLPNYLVFLLAGMVLAPSSTSTADSRGVELTAGGSGLGR
ncbi:O-antigen ligase family protein [Pseudokineococcus marinus]|uniref:O-antigen ligase family protein n=1 Tax=Pseudokineococcus marinus TaxID=351215 RepID=A0A849BM77_9ACTN|nr:O-antigen ligase family protein [Pseudokineococcus marinus]NNH21902.1 O-antigen ligase family protein [Pseudokineococcus marinus]